LKAVAAPATVRHPDTRKEKDIATL